MPLNEGAVNEIKPFAPQGTVEAGDLMSTADYQTNNGRLRGHQVGIADRGLMNRSMRQISKMAAGLAQYIANRYDHGVKDDADLDAVEAGLAAAVFSQIQANVPEMPDLEPIRAKLEKTQTGLKEYRVLDGNYQLVSTDAGAMLGMAGDIQIGLQGTGQYVQASVYTIYNPFNTARMITYVDGVSIVMAGHGPLTTCRIKPYGLVTLMYLGYNKWLCTGAGVES
jgi:hypothetical protein